MVWGQGSPNCCHGRCTHAFADNRLANNCFGTPAMLACPQPDCPRLGSILALPQADTALRNKPSRIDLPCCCDMSSTLRARGRCSSRMSNRNNSRRSSDHVDRENTERTSFDTTGSLHVPTATLLTKPSKPMTTLSLLKPKFSKTLVPTAVCLHPDCVQVARPSDPCSLIEATGS
jgi:hypothetical protein